MGRPGTMHDMTGRGVMVEGGGEESIIAYEGGGKQIHLNACCSGLLVTLNLMEVK